MGADSNIGATIGGYRIESLIGRGGMGAVYLAEHAHLERKVALKVLAFDLAGDEDFRQRFVRESRLAAKLYHPNIIPIYDAGEAGGVLYIAMHYVEGTDLGAVLRERGPLDASYALFLMERIGGALNEAHANGLVHRDVKPGNVMIGSGEGERQQVFLTDFGLVKSMDSRSHLTQTGYFVGTLNYAAPEMFRGEEVDGRADVYALGCVLYECLTGEIPFARENQAALITAHLFDPPPSVTEKRPELPAALDGVVARALEKDRDARYATCGELASATRDAIGAASGPLPPAPPPPASLRPMPLAARRPQSAAADVVSSTRRGLSRRVIAVVAAVVVLVSGAVALLLTRGGGGAKAHVIATVRLGSTKVGQTSIPADPFGVAVGEGSVWVTDTAAGVLLRIEPSTNRVAQRITVGTGGSPFFVAAGEGAIWVQTMASVNALAKIDPTQGKMIQAIQVGKRPQGVAVGGRAVWVANTGDDTVSKIDPRDGSTLDTIDVGTSPLAVAVGQGAVWVANQGDGTVTKIDPGTDKVLDTIPVGSQPTSIAAGEGFVWVANQGDATMSKIDPTADDVVDTFEPAGFVATGGGFVWVVEPDGHTMSQLDPKTDKVVTTITVGNGAFDVAFGEDSVWVVNAGDRTVSRIAF